MNKQKGSNFEREICKKLSMWWTNGEREDVFWRTSQSGGRSTTRSKKGKSTKNQAGDICATDPIGQPLLDLVTIEIKRGRSSFTIQDLLDKPPHAAPQMYEKWIEQAEESRKQAKTPYWLIILKRDKRIPLVMVPRILHEKLQINLAPYIYVDVIFAFVCIFPLNIIFDYVKPSLIQEISNARYKSN